MTTMRLLALACTADRYPLEDCRLIEPTASGGYTVSSWIESTVVTERLAPLRATSYEVSEYLFRADKLGVLGIDNADALIQFDERLEAGIDAVLLFIGPNSAMSRGLSQLIQHITVKQPRTPYVVFAASRDSDYAIEEVAESGSPHFRIPAEGAILRESDRGIQHFWNFAEALKEIQEARAPQPTIGVGALLVSCTDGTFFWSRRTWKNGLDKFGTFGGPLERNGTVVETVKGYGRSRYRIPPERLTAGPLLACTNMHQAGEHYVDMTFLFTTPREFALPEAETGWCNIEEMIRRLQNDLLYAPVAHAFMRFCALEAYARLGRVLLEPAVVSWIGPIVTTADNLPTDRLLEVAALLFNENPKREHSPLFFEIP